MIKTPMLGASRSYQRIEDENDSNQDAVEYWAPALNSTTTRMKREGAKRAD